VSQAAVLAANGLQLSRRQVQLRIDPGTSRFVTDREREDDRTEGKPMDSPETVSEDEEGAVGKLGLPDLSVEDEDE
jgi:hypothetical protein